MPSAWGSQSWLQTRFPAGFGRLKPAAGKIARPTFLAKDHDA